MPRLPAARRRCRPCSRTCAKLEADIERIRADQASKTDALGAIQTRFYEAGAEVTRIEQGIQFTRELRQRQRSDFEQAEAQVADLTGVLQRDRGQLEALAQELATMVPGLDAAHAEEARTSQALQALRAGAVGVAADLGHPCAGRGARPAGDRGGTRAHRAVGEPAAAAAAAAGAPGE